MAAGPDGEESGPYDRGEMAKRKQKTKATRSLLVVEDEPNIVVSLRFLMERAGFEVRVAPDGEAALQAINAQHPDVVLLYVMLPKRDGYSVCRAIRERPECADIRIVMLTAKGRVEDREMGLAAGADEYVIKPFSTRDLVQTVLTLVEA